MRREEELTRCNLSRSLLLLSERCGVRGRVENESRDRGWISMSGDFSCGAVLGTMWVTGDAVTEINEARY